MSDGLRIDLGSEALDQLVEALLPRFLEHLREHDHRDDGPRYLSVAAAAEYAGTSPAAIRHWIARDRLPVIQEAPGHRIVIDRIQLDRWLAERNKA